MSATLCVIVHRMTESEKKKSSSLVIMNKSLEDSEVHRLLLDQNNKIKGLVLHGLEPTTM